MNAPDRFRASEQRLVRHFSGGDRTSAKITLYDKSSPSRAAKTINAVFQSRTDNHVLGLPQSAMVIAVAAADLDGFPLNSSTLIQLGDSSNDQYQWNPISGSGVGASTSVIGDQLASILGWIEVNS